jgi:hypothetical protein
MMLFLTLALFFLKAAASPVPSPRLRGLQGLSDPMASVSSSEDREVAQALHEAAGASGFYSLDVFKSGGLERALEWLEGMLADSGQDRRLTTGDLTVASSMIHAAHNQSGLCPLTSSVERKEAAMVVGGSLARLVQVENALRAWFWSDGEHRPLNPATDVDLHSNGPALDLPFTLTWKDLADAMAILVLLPTLVLTDGGNRTTWFNTAAQMSCWEPSALADGPMAFKYEEVSVRLSDPAHKRDFYTSTAPQSTNYFSRGALLFVDGERHYATRMLLERAGFARRYPVDLDLLESLPVLQGDGSSVDPTVVLTALIPIIMKSIWGDAPPAEVVAAVMEYGKYGKYAIFGKVIHDFALGPAGITGKLVDSRQKTADWAKTSDFARILIAARDTFFPGQPHFLDAGQLVSDLADASLFAGLVGSADLVTKCVQYQQRDASHVDLFKADPERYLIELMRYDSAVTSVTEVLQEDANITIDGRRLTLAKGTPQQLVLASANRDPKHWVEPDRFDPSRADLADTLSWNGRAADVEARDLSLAPRHCPGHCLSIKVGAAVCAKLTGALDDLRAAGKVGGDIKCNNFGASSTEPDLWEPPADMNFAPPYDHSNPALVSGAQLVASDVECKSQDKYIDTFDTVDECAEAVKAEGGKFFVYGKGWIRSGWCYMEFTSSPECHEGLQSHSYDFYDIPAIDAADTLDCLVDVVEVTASDAKGVMSKRNYTGKSVAVASQTTVESSWWFWKKVCRRDYKFTCAAHSPRMAVWESCCDGRSCAPNGDLQYVSDHQLSQERGPSWQTCKSSSTTTFTANPPVHPQLPQPVLPDGGCLGVSMGAVSTTLQEVYNSCPWWLEMGLQAFATLNKVSYTAGHALIPGGSRNHPLAVLLGKTPESSLLDPFVFDTYTIAQVVVLVHIVLRPYGGRLLPLAERVALPSEQKYLDRLRVYNFMGSPEKEIDVHLSSFDRIFDDLGMCVFDILRQWDFKDELFSDTNRWEELLGDNPEKPAHCPGGARHCTKEEYIVGVFEGYATEDGDPVYPVEMVNFNQLFRPSGSGTWDDGAETFLAFGMLASHRLRSLQVSEAPSLNGNSAPFVVRTLQLSQLAVRPGFARLGVDMFFNSAMEPVMVRTPDGQDLWRSEVDSTTWQYWKFVWRSSMFLLVTLVDHLWTSHFSVGTALAAAAREALPPNHALRRLLTMFTFGTIDVNEQAVHALAGPNNLLHRSTPFHDFWEVSEAAKASISPLEESFGAFVDDDKFEALHETIRDTPFFADGRLLFAELRVLVEHFVDIHAADWCDSNGNLFDGPVDAFVRQFYEWSMLPNAAQDATWLQLHAQDGRLTCSGFKRWLTVVLFSVTGYHRHVGTVADLAKDPEFATFSWRAGESYGRPRQHMQMALIAASTAKIMPKLGENFDHLMEGLEKEAEITALMSNFRAGMAAVSETVTSRNVNRAVPYLQMDPAFVEASVAV